MRGRGAAIKSPRRNVSRDGCVSTVRALRIMSLVPRLAAAVPSGQLRKWTSRKRKTKTDNGNGKRKRTGLDWEWTKNCVKCQCRTEAKHNYSFTKLLA